MSEMEIAGANGHGALHCDAGSCSAQVTKPIQGTRRGVVTTWRLCRRCGAVMVRLLAERGERLLLDGWSDGAAAPARLTTSAAPPPSLPTPTPTPTETPMPAPGSRTKPPCLRCGKLHLAHRLCSACLSRATARGLVIKGAISQEQLALLDMPVPAARRAVLDLATPAKKAAATVREVPASEVGAAGSVDFWRAEAGGFEARLLAVGAALDAAGVDLEDKMAEGPAVALLARRLVAANVLVAGVGELAHDVGLTRDADLLSARDAVRRAVEAGRRAGAAMRLAQGIVDDIAEALGLSSEVDASEVLVEVERLTQLQKPEALVAADVFRRRIAEAVVGVPVDEVPGDDELVLQVGRWARTPAPPEGIIITPEELRRRVAELDAAEEAAEEADQLESRARAARQAERGHRGRALGFAGVEVACE